MRSGATVASPPSLPSNAARIQKVVEPTSSAGIAMERAHRVIAVAIAVALAFATGVVVPRHGARRAQGTQGAGVLGSVREDRVVREVAQLAGVTLRLERIRQGGPVVEARFSVLDGLDATSIREVFVDVALETGEAISIEDARVRAYRGGFVVTFVLHPNAGRVRQLRIMAIHLVTNQEPAPFAIDIARIWPVSQTKEPHVLRVDQRRAVAGTSVRLVSLLLWHNRIEAILDMSQSNRTAKRSFALTRLIHTAAAGPALPANLATLRESGDRVHLDFDGVAEDATRLTLFLGQPTTIIDGPWTWVLQSWGR